MTSLLTYCIAFGSLSLIPAMPQGQGGVVVEKRPAAANQTAEQKLADRKLIAEQQAELARQAKVAAQQNAHRRQAEAEQHNAIIAQLEPPPVMSEENFNQLVFRNQGNAQTARKRMDTLLKLRTDAVDRVCSLTDIQMKKLQLAGRGDIKRYFDRIEDLRQKFRTVQNDRNRINEVLQEIQPMQRSTDAIFGNESIFVKTLRNTLTSDQFGKYEQIERERQEFSYGAKIEMAVAMLDNTLPLRDDQRLKLVELLLQETKPPKRSVNTNYDYYFVMVQMARLPEDKIKPLFDESQWRIIRRVLDQMKVREPQLKQLGMLADE